jgi:hypothetical protein
MPLIVAPVIALSTAYYKEHRIHSHVLLRSYYSDKKHIRGIVVATGSEDEMRALKEKLDSERTLPPVRVTIFGGTEISFTRKEYDRWTRYT